MNRRRRRKRRNYPCILDLPFNSNPNRWMSVPSHRHPNPETPPSLRQMSTIHERRRPLHHQVWVDTRLLLNGPRVPRHPNLARQTLARAIAQLTAERLVRLRVAARPVPWRTVRKLATTSGRLTIWQTWDNQVSMVSQRRKSGERWLPSRQKSCKRCWSIG